MDNVDLQSSYNLEWKGPLILQGNNGELFFNSPFINECGIYLFTIEYNNSYMIYFAGLTTRPFKTRVKEHIKEYRKGTYTIFDTESLLNGKRVEIWHGMWFKKATKTPEMMNKFILRSNELQPEIEKLLSTFRIFLAPLNVDKRALWRIEAAIMNNLYKANEPFKNIPDKGMHLSPRWKRETPFLVFNQSNIQFHGLQQCFEA